MRVEWKSIGSEPNYEASSVGQIRRCKGGTGAITGAVLKPYMRGKYLSVNTYTNGVMAHRTVHSLVAEAFLGAPPVGLQVNHKDGNKLNNAAENFEYMTPRGNIEHAISMGLKDTQKGGRGNSKLTAEIVAMVRSSSLSGYKLCRQLNVTESLISKIRKRSIWRHVP